MNSNNVSSPSSLRFVITDHADLTLANMKLGHSGLLKGASYVDVSLIKTIISELGTNIIKYAKNGVMTISRYEVQGTVDIQIQAQDAGPGISSLDLAMQDRFSTGTSLGLGLPGVRRMADTFSIKSKQGMGTTVLVKKRIEHKPTATASVSDFSTWHSRDRSHSEPVESMRSHLFEIASHVRPMPGEVFSGDMAVILELDEGLLLALVDVSGHGRAAHELSEDIRQCLSSIASSNLTQVMASLHDRLIGTRGAAISLLFLDPLHATLKYCGVGNTGTYRVKGHAWHPISKDGVLGHRLPTLIEDKAELVNGDVILVWTDGLSELAARNFIAGQAHYPATAMVKELVSTLGRPFDDAGCIVLKWLA